MPKNASVGADGFRFYPWPGGDTPVNRAYNATERADLLSVTSVRTLCGEPFQLVAWKIANVVNLAMGVRKQTRIGPRGGVKEVYVKDGDFPGDFVSRMVETEGIEAKLDDVRRWLRNTADEPRDVAATRGSVVHKMIEVNTPLSVITPEMVRLRIEEQRASERGRSKAAITDDDVAFVTNAMAQYWDMRATIPFVIVAQEPQVYNLTHGYGGSADVLIWFLGTFAKNAEGESIFVPLPGADVAGWQRKADTGHLTLADVEATGGFLAVGDWKTSKGVYTGHVVQTIAYMNAEFVAEDGIIDTRLSDLLAKAVDGLVIHIRPNFWAVDTFSFRADILGAFLGSVRFARMLAAFKEPGELFEHQFRGIAEGTGESTEEPDGF